MCCIKCEVSAHDCLPVVQIPSEVGLGTLQASIMEPHSAGLLERDITRHKPKQLSLQVAVDVDMEPPCAQPEPLG